MLAQRDPWERVLDYNIGTNRVATKTRNASIINGIRYHNRVYRSLEVWQQQNAPDQKLYVEPWLRNTRTKAMCQPDAVIVDPLTNTGIVVEVKMNWKDGRDEKLLNLYLHAAKTAFGLEEVWPALITSNVAHLGYEPRLGLGQLLACADWQPGDNTPVVLVP